MPLIHAGVTPNARASTEFGKLGADCRTASLAATVTRLLFKLPRQEVASCRRVLTEEIAAQILPPDADLTFDANRKLGVNFAGAVLVAAPRRFGDVDLRARLCAGQVVRFAVLP